MQAKMINKTVKHSNDMDDIYRKIEEYNTA